MSDATPYGGAVKTCPNVEVFQGVESHDSACLFDGCSGGWVDVPTTVGVDERGLTGPAAGPAHSTRPASWAYPQPGDWAIDPRTNLPPFLVYGIYLDTWEARGATAWKLIVDRPNASRIPGTETPT
jgi:hypothetical protein